MSENITAAVESVVRSWRDEANERRKRSRIDPVADALDFCAGELAVRLRDAQQQGATESVAVRARREGVTEQTVRAWIRAGVLPAQHGPKGYVIPSTAVPVRRAG